MTRDSDKSRDTYEMYRHCRDVSGHDAFIKRSEQAMRYFASDQWLAADRLKMQVGGRGNVTVNQVFHTVTAVVGELSQLSTDVRYDAISGDDETADALNKLSEHVDRQNKSYIHDQAVLMAGLLTGRAYYDQRIDFTNNMQGDIKLSQRRAQNIILGEIDSPDPNTWDRVFTTEVVSLDDIEMMFGKNRAKDMKGMPLAEWLEPEDRTLAQSLGINRPYMQNDGAYQSTIKQYRLLSHQHKTVSQKDFFVDLETGDMSEIPENWPREKVSQALEQFGLGTIRKRAKSLKWIVTVNNEVMHDEDSPYKYFTVVPFFPFFLDGATLSLFDVLKGPQDLLNKALSEEVHILGTSSNSGWKIKQGSLKNMTTRDLEEKGSANGLALVLDEVGDAERIQPASPPSGYSSLSDRARGWVQELGKLTPSMAGSQRADAAGEGIRQQLSRAPINLAIPLTMFHFTKQLLAEHKLDLFQTYYKETRIVKIAATPYGKPEQIGINVPQEDGSFINDVTAGSYVARLLPTGSRLMSDEYAFDELMQLKEAGVTVPNNVLLAVSSIAAKTEVLAELRAANSGDISPEEQHAKEVQMQTLDAELQALLADVDAKKGQKILSLARAERAMAEVNYNPRQESNQINRQRLLLEHQRALAQQDDQRQAKSTDTALELTKLDHEKGIVDTEQSHEVALEGAKAAVAPKTPPTQQPRKSQE